MTWLTSHWESGESRRCVSEQEKMSWAALLSPGWSTRYSRGVTMEWQKEMWRETYITKLSTC